MRMCEIVDKNEEDLNIRNMFIRLMIILIISCSSIGIGLWLLL